MMFLFADICRQQNFYHWSVNQNIQGLGSHDTLTLTLVG